MSTETRLSEFSKSLEETLCLGEKIGKRLLGNEIIELVGDVGSGKTAFIRGLVSGSQSEDEVASPSFTINKVYKSPKGFQIDHFDFYRLSEAGIILSELSESLSDEKTVVALEWADLVEGVLPKDRLRIIISTGKDINYRTFSFIAGKNHNHLIENL